MSRSDRDLDALATELSDVLRELRAELRRPQRGSPGVLRPPTPRELLGFTERALIPAAIAVLEANIRALELLASTIRRVEDSTDPEARARTATATRPTLDRLDAVLEDLQDALAGDPRSPETRRLLDEARDLRAEIDDRLRGTADRSARRDPEPARSGTAGHGTERRGTEDEYEIPVDVEDELESIKRDLAEEGPTNDKSR